MSESLEFMRLALSQAAIAIREGCAPYPGVGVVIVHQNRALVRAHNGAPGSRHAEPRAIEEALTRELPLKECVLYSTLEPCCNQTGMVHACTREIIQAGIPEVHIALKDPYHLVRGQGIYELKQAGIRVEVGEYENETRWLLRGYLARFCCHCGWPVEES